MNNTEEFGTVNASRIENKELNVKPFSDAGLGSSRGELQSRSGLKRKKMGMYADELEDEADDEKSKPADRKESESFLSKRKK